LISTIRQLLVVLIQSFYEYKLGIKLTPNGTLSELKDFCIIKKPGKLIEFLDILSHYGKVIV
jgi:hypothetical protein